MVLSTDMRGSFIMAKKEKKVSSKAAKEMVVPKNAKGFQKIGVKVLSAAFIVIICITVLLISNAISFSKERLIESEVDAMESVAETKGIALEQYIEDQDCIAKQIAANSAIIAALADYAQTGEINPAYQAIAADGFKTVYENTGEIYENLFVTAGPVGYADCLDNTTLHDVSEENFYIECKENGSFIGNNVSPVTGRPVYVIAYAVTASTGEFLGTINMSIDMGYMSEDIVTSDKYSVSLLDMDGYMIGTNGNEEDLLSQVADEEMVASMVEAGLSYNILDLSSYGLGTTYLAYYASDNFITEISLGSDVITESATEMGQTLIFIGVIFTIIGLILLFILITIIVKPITTATNEVTALIADVEGGKGDLTQKLSIKSKDEIGILVNNINNLISTMKNIISTVQSTTNNVSISSSNISAEIGRAEDEISTVSSTMEEMTATSEETAASLAQISEKVETIASLVEEVNNHSMEEAQYANTVVEKVNGIKEKSLEERELANEHLQEVTENLRVKIQNAKQVQEIANLTDEILSITSQTNLLSLNASIEAARAGEAGKGFAVVADEIRQLADSSKDAANSIQEVTENVIKAVEALAAEAENVTEFMISSNEEGHAQTDELTENYSNDIQKLAEAMSVFKDNSDSIQASMEQIRTAIDAVNVASDEQARGISSVAEATVELSNNLQTVVGKTNENVQETSSLSDEMNKFKV